MSATFVEGLLAQQHWAVMAVLATTVLLTLLLTTRRRASKQEVAHPE